MQISQKYLHDRLVLLLLSANVFLTLLGSVLIFLRLSGTQGGPLIVTYKANEVVDSYVRGNSTDILLFVVFLFMTLGLNIALSARIYGRHRSYALTVLGLGTLVSVLTVIVSNALLVLG